MTAPGDGTAAALAQRVDATLEPLLPPHTACAILPFPTWGNPGDHAIWLGQINWLWRAGHDVLWWSSLTAYEPEAVRRELGDGVILLSGGGNFGDLYPDDQSLRERVVADFPETPIVQLPQSIHFEDDRALARAVRVIDAHPNFTLVVREQRSFELARQAFRSRVVLCPDMAFAIGGVERVGTPSHDVLWLARADSESSAGAPPVRAGLHRTDWIADLSRVPVVDTWTATGQLASRMVRWGLEALSSGRVVVTDRLHGHILSLMVGIPHVVLDNSYGKVGSFYRTWSRGSPLARWADSVEEAVEVAAELVEGTA